MPRVVTLTTFPVKGCAGMALPAADLLPAGIEHDRSFLVVGADGQMLTQRRHPALARIRPTVRGEQLALRAAGVDGIVVDVVRDGPRRDVRLFGQPMCGIDQGEAVASWLGEVLGEPSRLVRVPPDHDRVTDGRRPSRSGYADSSAVHLLSTSSLRDLGARIAANGGRPVPDERFRANVVVAGWERPHTEDGVDVLRIGTAVLGFTKLALRCVVTTVDQEAGRRDGHEPLRTLAGYRRDPGGGVAFGAKFAVLEPGRMAVGDRVVAVLGPGP